MDEDDRWLRQPWDDADPPPRQTSGRSATGTEALLIPLARAQDAVARLEKLVFEGHQQAIRPSMAGSQQARSGSRRCPRGTCTF